MALWMRGRWFSTFSFTNPYPNSEPYPKSQPDSFVSADNQFRKPQLSGGGWFRFHADREWDKLCRGVNSATEWKRAVYHIYFRYSAAGDDHGRRHSWRHSGYDY